MEHFNLADRLHTDVLSEHYGKPAEIEVLEHNNMFRTSLLKTGKVARTYALTLLSKLPAAARNIGETIRQGAPIGQTFRDAGYGVRKNVIWVYSVEVPQWLQEAFDNAGILAKARIAEVLVRKGSTDPVLYGTVAEVYSPDFRSPAINAIDLGQINASVEALSKKGIKLSEVWRRLGSENDWSGLEGKVAKAKEDSQGKIVVVRRAVRQYLAKDMPKDQ